MKNLVKICTGIRVDKDIIKEIDSIKDSEQFLDLNPTRSEMINAVLWDLFIECKVPQDRFYRVIRRNIIICRKKEYQRRKLLEKGS